jgi:hypothetical protein
MKRFVWSLTLAWLILAGACSPFDTANHSPLVPGLAQTIAAQTLSANVTLFPPKTDTPQPLLENNNVATYAYQAAFTPAPTSTPVPMLTPFSFETQALVNFSDACVNAAEFIKDITIPDDTKVKAGQTFLKVWEFKNVGTCTWTPDYALIFIWGDRMDGQSPKPLGVTVMPGQTIPISIELTAPKDMDSCQGNWMFLDSLGQRFGTGYSGKDFFWVSVIITGGRNAQWGLCGGGS